jgi:hypothetical protein
VQTTIYIRKENEDKWKELGKDRSKFVNEALAGNVELVESMQILEVQKVLNEAPVPQAGRYVLDSEGTVHGPTKEAFVPKAPDPVMGYPCCMKKAPCKHWKWDGVTESYINELTGEVKPAEL